MVLCIIEEYNQTEKSIFEEENEVAITINIYYSGKDGNAKKFAQEMV